MSVLGVAISTVSTPLRKISTVGCHEVELLGRVGTSSDLHRVVVQNTCVRSDKRSENFSFEVDVPSRVRRAKAREERVRAGFFRFFGNS